MQDEKKSILSRLYFARAALSKISQNNDGVVEISTQMMQDVEKETSRRKRLKDLYTQEAELRKEIETEKKKAQDQPSYKFNLAFNIIAILITVVIGFFLFRWWVNRDYSFWIGLLAFPVGLFFAFLDLGYFFVQCIPSCFEASQEKEKENWRKAEAKLNQVVAEIAIRKREPINTNPDLPLEVFVEDSDITAFTSYKKTEREKLQKPFKEESDLLYRILKNESLIDERDWEHLDVIIFVLETGRAETMKEALQQADLFVRHNEIKQMIRTSALAICKTIHDSIGELSHSIELRLSELQTEMIRIGDAQDKISTNLNSIVDSQKLNNALLEKANVSSERLVADVHRMRKISDEAYYGI